MFHNPFAAKDFSKRTLKALTDKGIFVVGCTFTSNDGDTAYTLSDGRMMAFLDVLDLSTAK
jgi:hypothetical protein